MPEEKKSVVPRLRFPEFRDAEDWEVKQIQEVCGFIVPGRNQTACGHPTLKDGVCFGPHALTPSFMESRNRRVFVALISLIHTIGTPLSVSPGIP